MLTPLCTTILNALSLAHNFKFINLRMIEIIQKLYLAYLYHLYSLELGVKRDRLKELLSCIVLEQMFIVSFGELRLRSESYEENDIRIIMFFYCICVFRVNSIRKKLN